MCLLEVCQMNELPFLLSFSFPLISVGSIGLLTHLFVFSRSVGFIIIIGFDSSFF